MQFLGSEYFRIYLFLLDSFFVGKTELAKQVAKYLHKDAKKVSNGLLSC